MAELIQMKIIARIRTDFATKFGVPRQSGLVDDLEATIIFEPEYRNPDALRGLEGFSYLWLIWQFSEAVRDDWSPTVRPPRLGGNVRKGVFATRSPFRPNPIGLSSVKIAGIDFDTPEGPVIRVRGADLMDGTPILDIKPYVPHADSHPEAMKGFTAQNPDYRVKVVIPEEELAKVPAEKRSALRGVLAEDPRPAYQRNPERVYGMPFAGMEVKFRVEEDTLYVLSVEAVC